PLRVIVAHAFPMVLLLALEWLEILPTTFHIDNGNLVLTAPILDFTPLAAIFVIGLSIVTQFANTILSTLADPRAQERPQDRVYAETWHLKQLLPPAV